MKTSPKKSRGPSAEKKIEEEEVNDNKLNDTEFEAYKERNAAVVKQRIEDRIAADKAARAAIKSAKDERAREKHHQEGDPRNLFEGGLSHRIGNRFW